MASRDRLQRAKRLYPSTAPAVWAVRWHTILSSTTPRFLVTADVAAPQAASTETEELTARTLKLA